MNSYGAKQYKSVSTQSGIENASPHRLIQMLIDGALERINTARGHMEHGNASSKGENISSAISIIGGLQASLDKDAGGEIAKNLDNLYDYMGHELMLSNQTNDVEKLDRVAQLIRQIKMGWDGIEQQSKSLGQAKTG